MTSSGATAEVKAHVNVRPVRSQVFLVAASVVAGIAVICSAALIAFGQNEGWGFLIFAVLVLFGGYLAWTKSQSDVDLLDAHPTLLALPDGTTLTTDSRTLRSPDSIHAFTQILQEVLCRRQLPPPDGLVDSNAQLIPDSKNAALTISNMINSKTQTASNALIDKLGLADSNSMLAQQSVLTPLDELPTQNMNNVLGA